MKVLIALGFLVTTIATTNAWSAEVYATCKEVINPQVGSTESAILSAGDLKLMKDGVGYFVDYKWWEMEAQRSGPNIKRGGASVLAFEIGCVFEGEKTFGLGNCKETDDVIHLKNQWTGGDNQKTVGKFHKKSRQLQIALKSQNAMGFYYTKSNVLFQCE